MQRDLTKGNVTKNLMFMAMPAIFGSLAEALYNLADMFWIGKISATAVAAVTVFSSVYFLVWILSSIIGISSVSLISQSYGAGDKNKTAQVVEQTLVFKGLVAFITMAVMVVLLKPLLMFLADDAEVIANAMEYGYIRLFFLPIFFSSATLGTAMRCVGDSRRPMIIMIISSVLNIVLDPIFMFETIPIIGLPGLGLGVFGAALATCVASSVTFIYGVIILAGGFTNIKIKLSGLLKLDKEIDKKLIMIGLPVGFEMTARELAGIVVMKFTASYGTAIIAAFGITFRLSAFAFMIMNGLSNGGGAIVGQNLGANNVERAEKTAYAAAKVGTIILGTVTLIVCLAAPQIIGFFVDDAAVIAPGSVILRLMMVGATIFSVALSLSCVFTGSGYNFPYVVSSIAARWVVQIPWLYISVVVLKLPYVFVAYSHVAAEITETIILLIYFYKGNWKYHRVAQEEAVAS